MYVTVLPLLAGEGQYQDFQRKEWVSACAIGANLISLSDGRHSGPASLCEREPESRNHRGTFCTNSGRDSAPATGAARLREQAVRCLLLGWTAPRLQHALVRTMTGERKSLIVQVFERRWSNTILDALDISSWRRHSVVRARRRSWSRQRHGRGSCERRRPGRSWVSGF